MKIQYEKIALNFLILFFKVSCLGCLVYFIYAAIFDGSISSITILQIMIISFLMLKEFQRYK